MSLAFCLQTCLFISILVLKEALLLNQMDCILKGIQNETQARNESYRELIRNTCGMFGVPPNYVRLRHGDDFFFTRAPSVFVAINLENGTFRIDRQNKTSGDSVDYSSIREEEELPRKHLVLAVAFLFLLQLFLTYKVILVLDHFQTITFFYNFFLQKFAPKLIFFFFLNQQWSYIRHFFYPSFKFMVAQILFFMLVLLTCVLCKSLTFGQIRLFSSDRTVFRGEWQVLPVLRGDFPKMEPESQVSLVIYLLNPPKLVYSPYYNYGLNGNATHLFNSNYTIYHSTFVQMYMNKMLPWYLLIWSLTVGIVIICIALKTTQIIHLLIQGKLFAYTPRHRPTAEERWNSLIAKVDKICDVAEKKEKIDELQDIKIDEDWEKEVDKSVSELNKREKTD